MKTNTLSPEDCNALIQRMPCESGPLPSATTWQRVDVGFLETYVGDSLYVITLIERLPKTIDEVQSQGESVEETVIRYLQGEGFVGEQFVYLGLQRFDKDNLPEGLEGIM